MIQNEYENRYAVLEATAKNISLDLHEILNGIARIDLISVRTKRIERFVEKAMKLEDGNRKYQNPLEEIQDQIGARVVVF